MKQIEITGHKVYTNDIYFVYRISHRAYIVVRYSYSGDNVIVRAFSDFVDARDCADSFLKQSI